MMRLLTWQMSRYGLPLLEVHHEHWLHRSCSMEGSCCSNQEFPQGAFLGPSSLLIAEPGVLVMQQHALCAAALSRRLW